jgi:hypothetical protein
LTTTGVLLVAAAAVALIKPDIPLPRVSTPEPTGVPATETARATPAAPTATPSATATPSPSATPEVFPPHIALTPIPGAVPAGEDARIELTAVAAEKTDGGRPLGPADLFRPDEDAIYVFFSYTGLEDGVSRTFAWYKQGDFWPTCSDASLWEWGPRGATWYFCQPSEGWEPGEYEVRVFIETDYQGALGFTIAPGE